MDIGKGGSEGTGVHDWCPSNPTSWYSLAAKMLADGGGAGLCIAKNTFIEMSTEQDEAFRARRANRRAYRTMVRQRPLHIQGAVVRQKEVEE